MKGNTIIALLFLALFGIGGISQNAFLVNKLTHYTLNTQKPQCPKKHYVSDTGSSIPVVHHDFAKKGIILFISCIQAFKLDATTDALVIEVPLLAKITSKGLHFKSRFFDYLAPPPKSV